MCEDNVATPTLMSGEKMLTGLGIGTFKYPQMLLSQHQTTSSIV